MTKLSLAADRGRDNNLNLLRMLASIAVLVSHAWPLVYGASAVQPLQRLTGETLGTHAVHLFFVLSGFLIAASYERSSLGGYCFARLARLMPGLIAANVVIVFGLGLAVTTLPAWEYLTQSQTMRFFLGNSAIILPNYELPGVFKTNPFSSVHGSIWTLRYELACYVLVVAIGAIGVLAAPRRLLIGCILAYGVFFSVISWTDVQLHPILLNLGRLSFVFMVGVLAWVWRDRIILSLWGVAGFFLLAWLLQGSDLQFVAQVMFVAYAGFYLGYVPAGVIRRYNRFGDYSYGTYIYAFPVQGLVVWLCGVTSPTVHILLALPITLALAVLSWHYIEEPALVAGRRISKRLF